MWLTMYTPLYAYVVAPLQGLSENPFFAGRAVALAAALASAAALFLVRGRSAPLAWMLAGSLFLVRPVLLGSAFGKPDMLGVCASVLAVVCAERARGSRRWLAPCALLCVVAFATKQSFVAASFASVAYLVLDDRRRGLELAACLVLGFGAFFAFAVLFWGPGFWFCVFRAPQNPLSWSEFATRWGQMLQQPVAVLLLAGGLTALGVGFSRPGRALWSKSPFALYAAASAAVLLATLPKVGSANNYFIEWLFATCLLLAHVLRVECFRGHRLVTSSWTCSLLVLAATAEVALAAESDYAFTNRAGSDRVMASAREAASEIEVLSGTSPRLLNLYYAGFSYPLPGEICVSDPFLYTMLWNSGALDPGPLLDGLRAREYDGVLVSAELVDDPALLGSELRRVLFGKYVNVRRFPEFDYLVRR